MRPSEAAKLYRLGDAHRLRLTLTTVRLTVTGPTGRWPTPRVPDRPPRLGYRPVRPGPPRPLPTPTTPRSRPRATAAPTPSTAGLGIVAATRRGPDIPPAGTAAWCLVHGFATLWLNHGLPPTSATPPGRPTVPRLSSSTPQAPAGRVPPARSASAQVPHNRDAMSWPGRGDRDRARAAAPNTRRNTMHARGNRALVIGHRLVTHAADRAGIDRHHLTSSDASAQLRCHVAALANTGEHSSPLSLNQRVGGSIPSRRTKTAGHRVVTLTC